MPQLKIDLNKSRLDAIHSFNNIVNHINNTEFDDEVWNTKKVNFGKIVDDFARLRSALVIFGCSYSEDDEDWKNITDQFDDIAVLETEI